MSNKILREILDSLSGDIFIIIKRYRFVDILAIITLIHGEM